VDPGGSGLLRAAVIKEKEMQIASDQMIAGYPAIKVRNFLRRYRYTGDFAEAVTTRLKLSPEAAGEFLHELFILGLVEELRKQSEDHRFRLTTKGETLAETSAAKPIHRRTAERLLAEFMDRVHVVNATSEYLYRVQDVILFGSMLSDAKKLGDVDVAVNLEPKIQEKDEIEKWSMVRRRAAQMQGKSFSTIFEWTCWPMIEIYRQLKARSRSLSLHELQDVKHLPNLSYRILLGDPKQLAALIPAGRVV
jgi:hypothetical protein